MSLDSYGLKSTLIEGVDHVTKAVGGASSITKEVGLGVAVTRTGTGAYLLTWSESQGYHLGSIAGLSAVTPASLAGHTVVFGEYNATARTLAVHVRNAADAAHDLAANEWLTVRATFSHENLN